MVAKNIDHRWLEVERFIPAAKIWGATEKQNGQIQRFDPALNFFTGRGAGEDQPGWPHYRNEEMNVASALQENRAPGKLDEQFLSYTMVQVHRAPEVSDEAAMRFAELGVSLSVFVGPLAGMEGFILIPNCNPVFPNSSHAHDSFLQRIAAWRFPPC